MLTEWSERRKYKRTGNNGIGEDGSSPYGAALYCTVLTNDSENGMDYGLIWKMAA